MSTATPADEKHNHPDLWEAWIDVQEIGHSKRGTLYIIGDVIMSNRILRPFLIKRNSGENPEGELYLEVIPQSIAVQGEAVEVFYSEELQTPNQYKSVTIFAGSQMIARIEEIEVLL